MFEHLKACTLQHAGLQTSSAAWLLFERSKGERCGCVVQPLHAIRRGQDKASVVCCGTQAMSRRLEIEVLCLLVWS